MTTATPTAAPRRSRLQFGLRMLLLGLTAFAIGFPIWYRWPFEEVEQKYFGADPFGADPFGADPFGDPFAPPGAALPKAVRDDHPDLAADLGRRQSPTWPHDHGKPPGSLEDDRAL